MRSVRIPQWREPNRALNRSSRYPSYSLRLEAAVIPTTFILGFVAAIAAELLVGRSIELARTRATMREARDVALDRRRCRRPPVDGSVDHAGHDPGRRQHPPWSRRHRDRLRRRYRARRIPRPWLHPVRHGGRHSRSQYTLRRDGRRGPHRFGDWADRFWRRGRRLWRRRNPVERCGPPPLEHRFGAGVAATGIGVAMLADGSTARRWWGLGSPAWCRNRRCGCRIAGRRRSRARRRGRFRWTRVGLGGCRRDARRVGTHSMPAHV